MFSSCTYVQPTPSTICVGPIRVISKQQHVKQKRKFIRKAGVIPELPGEAWRGQQARCLISNPRVSMKREAEDIE